MEKSELPQSKIGSEEPIFASPLLEGAEDAVQICYAKQQFIFLVLSIIFALIYWKKYGIISKISLERK